MLPHIMWNTPHLVENAISIGHVLAGIFVHDSVHHKSSQALLNAYKSMCYTLIDADNGAQEAGSTPYLGTISDLTFNLFSILAHQHLSANALFWITVWITALGRGSWTASRGSSFASHASGTQNGVTWTVCGIWS